VRPVPSLTRANRHVVAPLHMFFFSSRRRHTRSKRDWSSDVCSSDLASTVEEARDRVLALRSPETRQAVARTARDRVAQWDIEELRAAWSESLSTTDTAAVHAHGEVRAG